MTSLAKQAFQEQVQATPSSKYLLPSPSPRATKAHVSKVARPWRTTLRRAGVPYLPLYHLRHTFATRLGAGGVADNFVTQMLWQGDAQVFKRYSQAKLNMMRENLEKFDRQANEHRENSGTPKPKSRLETMGRFLRMNELGGTPGLIRTPDPLLRRRKHTPS